jgi:hypothetical protein
MVGDPTHRMALPGAHQPDAHQPGALFAGHVFWYLEWMSFAFLFSEGRVAMNIDLRRRSDEVLNRLTRLLDSL